MTTRWDLMAERLAQTLKRLQLSPADPKISTRLSNGKNLKLFIACLLMGKVFNETISNPNSAPGFFTYGK